MQNEQLNERSIGMLSNFRYRRKWKQVTSVLSIFVVIGTIAALLLPAITLNQYICGLDVHTHETACYSTTTKAAISCNVDGIAIHSHDSVCYNQEGLLICNLKEITEHVHSEACYQATETITDEGHTHTDGCYNWIRSETLKCGMEESTNHTHDDTCYCLIRADLLCTEEERPAAVISGDPVLICHKPEITLHTHKGTCYEYDAQGNPANIICNQSEIVMHQHTDACLAIEEAVYLICQIPEHIHTDACLSNANLSAEEQAQVDAMILSIDALPGIDQVNQQFTAFDNAADTSGREAYTTALSEQVVSAFTQYEVLTQDQKACVTNAPKLMALKWLLPAQAPSFTEEEQLQLEEVLSLIDQLPNIQELSAALDASTQSRDLPGWEAAVKSAQNQVQVIRTLYAALSQQQKAAVTTIQALTDLERYLETAVAPAVTEEEKALVDELNRLISLLPDPQTLAVQDTLTEAYLVEISSQVSEIRRAYSSLNSVQQAAVIDEPKLTAIEEFLSEQTFGPSEWEIQEASTISSEIAALPSVQEVSIRFDELSAEPETLAAYQAKLTSQLQGLLERYEALHQEAKSLVTNIQAVTDLIAWLEESGAIPSAPDYTATSGTISAEVWLDGSELPADAQFVVSTAPYSPEQTEHFLKMITSKALQKDQGLLKYVMLDLHFADGQGAQIPFTGAAEVVLNFQEPILQGAKQITAFHIHGDAVENAGQSIQQTQKGIVTITLKLNGFSPIVIADTSGHVAEQLDGDYAYIYDAQMKADNSTTSGQAISTGTASWDSNDNAGNDTSDKNSILRTFDVATYTLSYKTGLRQEAADQGISGYRTGTVYFEFILPLSEKQGQFEPGSMGWLATYSDVRYEIVKEANRQILRGSFLAEPVSGNPVAIGNSISELNVAVRVLGMKNGNTVQPSFTLWLEGNHVDAAVVDGIPTQVVTGTTNTCETHGGQEFQTITPAEITISAVQRLNLALVRASAPTTSEISDFDFSTGNNLALNKSTGKLRGRIFCYGLTLQLVGKDATSGLKGIELPDEGTTITFDITMGSTYTDYNSKKTNLDSTVFRAQVWSGAPSAKGGEQQDGRVIPTAQDWPTNAAPFNQMRASKRDGCYNGGKWSFTQDASNKQLYHVSVSGFQIDVSSVTYFPATTADHNGVEATGRYYNASEVENAWNIQNACFSAGELWVIQPLEAMVNGTQKKIEEVYTDGNLEYQLRDSNFKVNGKAATQAVTTDDQSSYGFGLELPGSIESDIYYVTYNGGWNNPLTPGEFMGGYDYATPGQKMGIYHLISNDNPEGDHRGCAMEIFTKFDQKFFEPDGTVKLRIFSPSSPGNVWWSGEQPEIKVLWAARQTGNGWNHFGLTPDKSNSKKTGNNVEGDKYDWDMLGASSDGMYIVYTQNGSYQEEIAYYESLAELKAAGKQCIGVLVEIRGIVATGMNHVELTVNGKVRDDCVPGYVYMTSTHSRLWRIKDLAGIARSYYNLDTDGSHEEWMGQRLELIDQYVREAMPSHLQYNDFRDYAETKPLYEKIYWEKSCINGKTGNKNHSNALMNEVQKIWYKADGTTGGTYNRFHADTCLVVSHEVSIKKATAQTVTENGKTNSKTVYSLDLGQRVVDFKLTPTVKRTLGSGLAGEGNQTKTTITIKDTLPKELEYIAGSAYWGGSYTQDPKCAHPGTITGGTKLDPVVTKNSDGSTTLTWTLKDVVLTKLDTMELSPIYFSTRLTGVLEDQQGIKNTATIQSTGDNLRLLTEANNNKAVFGITIQKSEGASIVKLADQDKVELDAPLGFTMFVGNNSANDMEQQIIVDDLPWNGDGRGTSFTGAMNVTEFSVSEEFSGYLTYYYTTDIAKRGKKSTDYSTGSFTVANGWVKVTQGAAVNGMAPLNIPEDTVQVVAVGTLPAGKTVQMHTTIELPGSSGGNKLVNQLTMNTLNSQAASTVVGRTLSGLTWIDANHNGIQDNTEQMQSGVSVTLMKLENGEYKDMVTIQTGQKYDMTRNTPAQSYEAGSYLFYNLMPGTYAVRFTKGAFDITYYHASPVDVGDDTLDSDGIPTLGADSTLQKTEITGIVMPVIEKMGSVNVYNSPNHDSGFYAWGAVLPETGGAGTLPYTFSGWAMILTAFALMYNLKRKPWEGAR